MPRFERETNMFSQLPVITELATIMHNYQLSWVIGSVLYKYYHIIYVQTYPTRLAFVCACVLGETVTRHAEPSSTGLKANIFSLFVLFLLFNLAVLPILTGSDDMFQYDFNQSTCVNLALCLCWAFENSAIHFNVFGHFRMTQR